MFQIRNTKQPNFPFCSWRNHCWLSCRGFNFVIKQIRDSTSQPRHILGCWCVLHWLLRFLPVAARNDFFKTPKPQHKQYNTKTGLPVIAQNHRSFSHSRRSHEIERGSLDPSLKFAFRCSASIQHGAEGIWVHVHRALFSVCLKKGMCIFETALSHQPPQRLWKHSKFISNVSARWKENNCRKDYSCLRLDMKSKLKYALYPEIKKW